ncbi:MAG: hypothetical protein K8R48_03150 [Alphaproteobacteria bacterium]|nr:hypothetical protein [Alphaproteobacteria bacterium]
MTNDIDRDGEPLVKKPKTTGFKDTSKRLRRGKENHIAHRASLDWRQDRDRVCTPFGDVVDYVDLAELKAVVIKSGTGEALLCGDSARGLNVYYDSQVPVSQFYPRDKECFITLNPHHTKGELLNMLVRELRRAWQYYQGALINPMRFEPDEAILVNRAQQADVLMASVKVAWELKLAGEAEAWNFMAGSPMADVTRVFEIHAQKDFRTLNNGEASRAAYDKFFEEKRTKAHDKRIIHQMLLDDLGYMKAPQKFPKVGMDLFRKLGEMPYGRNYLSISSKKPPTDTCYSTIEDRSNANFLWFIKFERSFQEKEQEMLQESAKASANVVDFTRWSSQARRQQGPGT